MHHTLKKVSIRYSGIIVSDNGHNVTPSSKTQANYAHPYIPPPDNFLAKSFLRQAPFFFLILAATTPEFKVSRS